MAPNGSPSASADDCLRVVESRWRLRWSLCFHTEREHPRPWDACQAGVNWRLNGCRRLNEVVQLFSLLSNETFGVIRLRPRGHLYEFIFAVRMVDEVVISPSPQRPYDMVIFAIRMMQSVVISPRDRGVHYKFIFPVCIVQCGHQPVSSEGSLQVHACCLKGG